jgi:hypothetical protein
MDTFSPRAACHRAWGGLSSEEYYILLLTLITRSGCMLAELSTLNLNVINEVGVAHGNGRPVYPAKHDVIGGRGPYAVMSAPAAPATLPPQ